MSLPSLTRRQLVMSAGSMALLGAPDRSVFAQSASGTLAPARADTGVSAFDFDLGQVQLAAGRWQQNMDRTLAYLRFIDVDRLLYNFRANHKLSTQGAAACGGWEAPSFRFRSHSQGHFMSAWAQAWAVTGDTTFRDRANYMVAELAKCQAAPAGFNAGYLSGLPESTFDAAEQGSSGAVPYYTVHKTLAGLLDVWRRVGNTQARDVLLQLAAWVDFRTARLSYAQMQTTMQVEFGGMNAVMTDLYQQTGDSRWLTVARRWEHASVFDPLAANQDQLNGLHANTQVPKMVGAAREYKATGETRYRSIAENFWTIVTQHHSYVFGGNSVNEHFKSPNAIGAFLTGNTCESCNTYNMLKLTRELFLINPERVELIDYYENALMNQMLAQQNPNDPHGHVCYFTPTQPGARRVGTPDDSVSSYSRDYDTFTCCQGTGLETQTKLADSVYFYSGTTLYLNLFIASTLNWTARGITVTQTTDFPVSDTVTLKVTGSSDFWSMKIRIPAWTSGATISVNGVAQNIATVPGSYVTLSRNWAPNDTVTLRLPMSLDVRPTPDKPDVQAVTYGPVLLSGAYGNTSLSGLPALSGWTIVRNSTTALTFDATANGAKVSLIPFYDNHLQNYTVYWNVATAPTSFKLFNVSSGLLLGVKDMSVADGGLAIQWNDTGTLDHQWQSVVDGTALRFRNANSGKVLGVDKMRLDENANVLQWSDNGTADHRWALIGQGNGNYKVRNVNSGKLLALRKTDSGPGAQVIQDIDDGSTDNLWRFVALNA